ncbi:MAG TPA: N-acetylmuramic acid 6-phosphate etherase [Tepidisphaeraceae bacterium]|mgnify:CR=1 FL=1|nr:N-acetylmuramic acid 6-phosphate etherase [Tepidisphaeraceae bacterium]
MNTQPPGDRGHLLTEQRLAESMSIDAASIEQAVAMMNVQDRVAVEAVEKVRDDVVRAIKLAVAAFRAGGRLLYFGAGTSGRLGVLDASECPPTFRSDPGTVLGIIAGGEKAMFVAQEGAEDSADGGAKDVDDRRVGPNDVVMGMAAGGTTPYVHGALRRAKELGAKTIFLSCVQPVPTEPKVDVVIRPLTGPEVLTGSTRLKAGTATKLVLNQITTISMIQLGKCYENLMVDLRATNVKLWDRGARIVRLLTGLDATQSMELLKRAEGHVKVAIVMHKKVVSAERARELLSDADGFLRRAIG